MIFRRAVGSAGTAARHTLVVAVAGKAVSATPQPPVGEPETVVAEALGAGVRVAVTFVKALGGVSSSVTGQQLEAVFGNGTSFS